MAAKIRLARCGGTKKNPIYRVVVADSRLPRDGKFIEIVGRYNPQTQPSTIEIDEAKVKDWISKGAQPTDSSSASRRHREFPSVEELVTYLAKGLVDNPDEDGHARRARRRDGVRAASGRVRRRQGDRAAGPHRPCALRTIVRASGAHQNERVQLEIVNE